MATQPTSSHRPTLAVSLASLLLMVTLAGCTPAKWHAAPTPLGVPPTPVVQREFRGAWVATVGNLDWPSKPGLSPQQRRAEIVAICDRAAASGVNALVVQVRPSADAIYPSRLVPRSVFIGPSKDSNDDSLADWIEVAHSRGIELHAWLNPYRARAKDAPDNPDPLHVSRRHADWVRPYGGMLWIDPSEPAARQHVLEVVRELVSRYPLDGIHIDDYFYPYPVAGQEFDDARNYAAYRAAGGTLARADWRRNQVDSLVYGIYQTVKAERPSVRVGISPFGIWRPGYPPQVKGLDAYNALSADSRRWLAEGWVDYLAPQLYWPVNAPQQPFLPLLAWWQAQNVSGRAVWPGLNLTKYDSAEIGRQIDLCRRQQTGGQILYAARSLRPGLGGHPGAPWATLTLTPVMPWIAAAPFGTASATITSRDDGLDIDPDFTGKYVVYALNRGRWQVYVRWGPSAVARASVIGISRVDAAGREGEVTYYTP